MDVVRRPILLGLLLAWPVWAQEPQTEIVKWQDDKKAAVSITFDDSTENHFRVAIPLLNERGMRGTFFIITAEIPDARYRPMHFGRPMMDIIRESRDVASTRENVLERMTMLRHLKDVQHVEVLAEFNSQRAGRAYERQQFDQVLPMVDNALARLRETGAHYDVRVLEPPGKYNLPYWHTRDGVSWDELRRHAADGHEFGSHTMTHPYMSALDEVNNVYEIDTSIKEIEEQLGAKHTFSIECPHGIHDPRILPYVKARVPLSRNWVWDDFMDGIMRGDNRDPATSKHEYVQWQRGPLTKTPFVEMTGWVDKAVDSGLWLVLVIHGIEGIGWEALPTERLRAYLDYIDERETDLWVATFQDAAKYARERMASTVTTRSEGNAIEVSVRHTLDSKLYDLPLTAKTVIPSDWTVVRFRQGTEARWLPVHRENGETYVLYRIVPDGTSARLEPGAN